MHVDFMLMYINKVHFRMLFKKYFYQKKIAMHTYSYLYSGSPLVFFFLYFGHHYRWNFGEGNGNPLRYCLENPMDNGAWWTIIHGAARVGHDIATKPPPQMKFMFLIYFYFMVNHDKSISSHMYLIVFCGK